MRETVAPAPASPSGRGSVARQIVAWRRLLRWLAVRPDELATAEPIKRLHRMLQLIVSVIVAFAVANLATVWWTGASDDWMFYWLVVFSLAMFLLLVLPSSGWQLSTRRRLEEEAAIEEDVASGNDAIAPRASIQPVLLDSDMTSPGLITAGSFHYRASRRLKSRQNGLRPRSPPARTRSTQENEKTLLITAGPLYRLDSLFVQDQAVVAPILILFGVGLIMLYLIPAPPSGRHWQWLALIACLIIEGSVFIGHKAIFIRPFAVTASADGLAWRRWGRRHTIPWPEVRALGMIESPGWSWSPTWSWISSWSWNFIWSISLPAHLAYWVGGTHDTLMFMPALPGQRLPPLVENDVSGAGDPAWQLCATVVAKTGLPLRDLTPAAMRITAAWTSVRYRDYWRNLLAIPRGIASSTWGRLRYGIRTLAPLLLFVALLVAGLGMLVVQPRAYDARLAQAQSAKALLSDSMMKPSGLWPMGTTSRGVYTYLSDGYWLGHASEFCCDVYALAPPTFHAATVEATVDQVSSFDLSESGLAFRADDASHTMLVFVVMPNGEWQLKRFHIRPDGHPTDEQTLMYEGTLGGVPAIHQGLDAITRLAVMMRGTSYTFFINGQFVGGYQGDGPTSGHVGFYSEFGAGFSDFAVYPAPPPSPLFPV